MIYPILLQLPNLNRKKLNHKLLISEFDLEGYHVFCHGLENNNERGVLFYIASDIHVKVIDNSSALQECILLLLKGKGSNSYHNQILLGNIYRSPNSTQQMSSIKCLRTFNGLIKYLNY